MLTVSDISAYRRETNRLLVEAGGQPLVTEDEIVSAEQKLAGLDQRQFAETLSFLGLARKSCLKRLKGPVRHG